MPDLRGVAAAGAACGAVPRPRGTWETRMPPSTKAARQGPRVTLDWIYIRTRTLLLLGAAIAAGLGVLAWSYLGPELGASGKARARIEAAQVEMDRARSLSPAHEAIPRADRHLADAWRAFHQEEWAEATRKAEEAHGLARSILDAHAASEAGVRVAHRSGTVQIKRAGRFVWEDASETSILQVGDQIRTGADGSAQLVFFDGAMTTIKPGTLIEIRELTRDPDRKVQRVSERLAWGTMQADTRETGSVDSVHRVQTDGASVEARKPARFELSHDRERGASEVRALEGSVTLVGSEGQIEVPESTRVALDRGEIRETSELLPPPRLLRPRDRRSFVAPRESRVTLSWEAVESADFYHSQVARRPLFTSIEQEVDSVAGTRHQLHPLPPGTYYWRIAAVDERGRRGRWSAARALRVVGSEFRDPQDTEPPPLTVSEILVVGTNAILSGRTEPGAQVWIADERVDVNEDGSFTWVIKLRRDGRNDIQLLAEDAAGNETRRVSQAYVDVF